MRVLGIDPGLQLTGYGVVEFRGATPKLIDGGVLRFNAKQSIAKRLVELERELSGLIEESKPDRCAVEKVYSHYAHPQTAVLMGHARGVILMCVERAGVELVELAANRVKKNLTGHGHASKAQMQRSVQGLFKLKDLPEPPDVADAIAIALCGGSG
jgi:crossover junction endodeoxyribonuclease RuvC